MPDVAGINFSTAMASDGTLYMAYLDASSNLKAMKFSSTGWQQYGATTIDGNADAIIMTTDKNKVPYISYRQSSAKMMLQKYFGGSWTQLKSSACDDPRGLTAYYSFQVNNNSVPFIIWEGSWYEIAGYLNGNGCYVDTLGGTFGWGMNSSLTFSSANVPWVAGLMGSVLVKWYDNSQASWQTAGDSIPWSSSAPQLTSGLNSFRVILKLDANDVPYVLRTSGGSYPEVWRKSGTAFTSTGVLFPGPIKDVDFAKSTDNMFYATIRTDNGSNDSSLVYKYSNNSWGRFPTITNGFIPFEGFDNYGGNTKNISIEASPTSYYVVYNKGNGLIGTMRYVPQ
jgi:hypothetical protein